MVYFEPVPYRHSDSKVFFFSPIPPVNAVMFATCGLAFQVEHAPLQIPGLCMYSLLKIKLNSLGTFQ